ncbi:TPA: DUF1240 domain-containing protein [Morganella morganii]|nr:DUF1240 domain-containing protein [Morganella morganii]
MNKGKLIKLSLSLFLFFIISFGVFLLGVFSVYDFFNASDVVSLSYSSTLCLSGIIISYLFLSLLYNLITQVIIKKPKKNVSYQMAGILLVIWFFLSFPITWIGSYYLISHNYQKCPPTDIFTQYYVTDLSLCSVPYYEERTDVKK